MTGDDDCGQLPSEAIMTGIDGSDNDPMTGLLKKWYCVNSDIGIINWLMTIRIVASASEEYWRDVFHYYWWY